MSSAPPQKRTVGLPSDKTLQQAVKLSIKTSKPICFYFYVDSLKKKISDLKKISSKNLTNNFNKHKAGMITCNFTNRNFVWEGDN